MIKTWIHDPRRCADCFVVPELGVMTCGSPPVSLSNHDVPHHSHFQIDGSAYKQKQPDLFAVAIHSLVKLIFFGNFRYKLLFIHHLIALPFSLSYTPVFISFPFHEWFSYSSLFTSFPNTYFVWQIPFSLYLLIFYLQNRHAFSSIHYYVLKNAIVIA